MHTFGRHDIHIGADKSLYSGTVVDVLSDCRKLRGRNIPHVDAVSVEVEEKGLAGLDPTIGSTSLVRPRIPVADAYRAIVRDTFQRHKIPTGLGLDVGSGASGYMAAELLPPETQNTWIQMELSPKAVEMNKKANPGRTIVPGSYLNLKAQGLSNYFPVITGLSSLDATGHIDRAVEEIRQALQGGGILMHVQDTRPGRSIVHQELMHRGAVSPYTAIEIDDPNAEPNPTILYRHGNEAFDVIELFRRRLERALQENGGYEIVESDWVTAVGKTTEKSVSKHSELGTFIQLQTPGISIESASAAVTVARRK